MVVCDQFPLPAPVGPICVDRVSGTNKIRWVGRGVFLGVAATSKFYPRRDQTRKVCFRYYDYINFYESSLTCFLFGI
jgi:hypothetical protein